MKNEQNVTCKQLLWDSDKNIYYNYGLFLAGYILFVFEKYFLFNELLNVKFLRL